MYPDHPSLRSICSAIAMPRQMSIGENSSSTNIEQLPPVLLSFAPPQQPPAWTPAQLAPIVVRLANLDNVEGKSLIRKRVCVCVCVYIIIIY